MTMHERVAVVTGSGRGIGRVIALTLAEAGADVVITSPETAENEAVCREVLALGRRSIAVPCDVTSEKDVRDLVQGTIAEFGQIDVLVNNAGIAGPMSDVASMDLAGWNQTLAVNLTGTMLCTREVIKHMIRRRTGSIVVIASNVARRGVPGRSPYVASKWALIGFVQTVAHEVASYNIRVNAVCPGAVEGERIAGFIKHRAAVTGTSYEEALKRTAGDALMNRLISPPEVANAVLFLASDAASAITGQALNVCGGTVFS